MPPVQQEKPAPPELALRTKRRSRVRLQYRGSLGPQSILDRLGFRSITRSSALAARSGRRLPCSHSRTALFSSPNVSANCAWLRSSFLRIAATSTVATEWATPRLSSPRHRPRPIARGPSVSRNHPSSCQAPSVSMMRSAASAILSVAVFTRSSSPVYTRVTGRVPKIPGHPHRTSTHSPQRCEQRRASHQRPIGFAQIRKQMPLQQRPQRFDLLPAQDQKEGEREHPLPFDEVALARRFPAGGLAELPALEYIGAIGAEGTEAQIDR